MDDVIQQIWAGFLKKTPDIFGFHHMKPGFLQLHLIAE